MSERTPSRKRPAYIVAEYNGRKASILRTPSYKDTIKAVKKAFKSLRSASADDVKICALFKGHTDLVRITDDLWRDLLPEISEVRIVLDFSEGGVVTRNVAPPVIEQRNSLGCASEISLCPEANKTDSVKTSKRKLRLTILYSTPADDGRFQCIISPNARFQRLLDKFAKYRDVCPKSLRIYYLDERMPLERTFASYGVEDNDTINIHVEQTGGKPVIYLLPPTPTPNIRLDLALVKSWDFSALYPAAPIEAPASKSLGQAVSWTVDAKPDGTLFDHRTQREVAYLFWEAHTKLTAPISPPCSRPGTPTEILQGSGFDPSRPNVSPSNSVLLPFEKVTAYIDDALMSLGLHTEARTSFITYWLPDLQRHSSLALRFLPQAEYERTAPMTIEPVPDVTTRVFMVFKGVEASQLEAWSVAQIKGLESPGVWADIVGVNLNMAKDVTLFRALEWGGMEIK